jgi:hypothetical protein
VLPKVMLFFKATLFFRLISSITASKALTKYS